MRHPFYFIVSPEGTRYKTTANIGGMELIISTSIENHRDVNRVGVVESIPSNYDGKIRPGARVVVHHNIFRDFFDHKGKFKHSGDHIEKSKYMVTDDLIYLYDNGDGWTVNRDFVFVSPIVNNMGLVPYRGVVKYAEGIEPGEQVVFSPHSEYEIEVDGQVMYRMRQGDIAAVL